ncbi:MAG: SWIM zinc finger family protein [Acidobacteriota bacterium]
MGYWDWDWDYRPSKPRKAKNGIKAKSQRGEIGETWWSKRFITILESFDVGARLSRGRSYARSGQVMNLKISSELVTAKVQGSRPKPYEVSIQLEPLSEGDWRSVEKSMADQAIFMAKLLAGEMPRDIEEVFKSCRLSLFPARRSDLKSRCSCPDWSNPCKHVAAVYYIMAEKFDEDPFLIFQWRGRAKKQLIERLRTLRGSIETTEPAANMPQWSLPTEEAKPLAECLNNFWNAGVELIDLRLQPKATEIPDAVLKQLGKAPWEVAGKNVSDLLQSAYQAMVQAAERKAFSKN